MKGRVIGVMALAAAALWGEAGKENPVGIVLTAASARVVRAGAETAVAARSGDILFAGDALRAETAPAAFLFCPARTSQSVAPGGEVLLDAKQLKVKAGKLADQKPVAACFLPQVVRVAVASQQHYGITMTRGMGPAADPVPAEKLAPEVTAELAPLDKALTADPKDMGALVARAAVFEKYKLPANALAEYRRIGGEWKDAVWVRRQIFELEESLAAAAAEAAAKPAAGGQTFALAVGISKYQKLPQDLWLQFAHADAEAFSKHLLSPRGGSVPADNVLLLTDEKATTAGLRTAFQTFLKARAGKQDTVLIMVAGHGTVETAGSRGAYILTHDSDPQDLASTALPMAEVQDLFQEQLAKVGRVAVFVDVCRAGTIGSIRSTAVNGAVERLAEAEGEVFGLMASRPKELSFEGPQFGGGHGAFTYFLLKALAGDADKNKDSVVNVNEVIEYVRDQVAEKTGDKQHPRDFGTMDNAVALSDPSKPGIQLTRRPVLLDSRGEPLALASSLISLPAEPEAAGRFARALNAGRLLPSEPDNAFAALAELKKELAPEQYLRRANELRVALEDRGQQVLLRYLAGDQVPQKRSDFESASRYLEAAASLTPESLFLEGRGQFFRGRALLFDKKYVEAADLLERSVGIDPGAAYAYNALGIAYLEQGEFTGAAAAFRDAIRRAPYWAYPLHNLALAHVESGDYGAAIRRYQDAMRLAPKASYLPYNLGLVYQKTNRRREAEAAYRRAMALAPESAEPYNALGTLKAASGKRAEAEELYRDAIEKNPALLAARHNLALLLSERKATGREAIALWRDNLARSHGYLPSRLSLAEALAGSGETAAGLEEYREVLRLRPEYLAARLALAGLLEKSGDRDAALAELRRILERDPESAEVFERIGDLERAAGRNAEAADAYRKALERAADGGARKRLRRKIDGR